MNQLTALAADGGWRDEEPPRLKHGVGFWSMNGCRVVYSVGVRSDQEFGFAYGTLTNQAEAGEEVFKVSTDSETGDVSYLLRAVSKPRAALAQLGYPDEP